MAQNNDTLPRINLEAPGMPLPSRGEYLRQAGMLYDALLAARPLLYVDTPDLKAAAGDTLPDLVELVTAGQHWATAFWSLFSTAREHLEMATPDAAR